MTCYGVQVVTRTETVSCNILEQSMINHWREKTFALGFFINRLVNLTQSSKFCLYVYDIPCPSSNLNYHFLCETKSLAAIALNFLFPSEF